jgi:DNA-binding NtrC family response regulator
MNAGPETISVLVVDDEHPNLVSLEKILTKENYHVFAAESGRAALEVVRKHRVHVVLTDLMMPGMSGMELMKALATVAPHTEVIMMTAYGTIETAVEAMREGAYDFVEKPLKKVHIVRAVRKAVERYALLAENRSLRSELNTLKRRSIVGSSAALQHALDMASQVAPTSTTVLLLGQSGTGKELFARYIHEHSQRQGPFVGVNLASLPETIVEAELFGYERGSFTGATQRREGRLMQAHQGTLFLDEIGELSPSIQVKLLRVLQEGEFEPLGGKATRSDFRLVAATNRDLGELVRRGQFREDLYYRLNVVAIVCPTLAERRDDIPLLVDHFLDVYGKKNNKPSLHVSKPAMDALMHYSWPGNIRELENVIERAVVLARTTDLRVDDLPKVITGAHDVARTLTFPIGTPLDEIERQVIHMTLEHTRGDKPLAAQLLGISLRTIYRKLGTDRDGESAADEPS